MKERKIWKGVSLICDALRESEEYTLYTEAREALAHEPEKVEQINAFRTAKYMQQNGMEDGMHNTMEELFERQQGLRSDKLCSQFLESEAKLCNMIRKVVEEIMDVVEVEIPAAEKGEEACGGQSESEKEEYGGGSQ